MSDPPNPPELLELLEGLCNGQLDPERHDRLQSLLRDHPEAQRVYLDYLDMHLALGRWGRQEGAEGESGIPTSQRGRPSSARQVVSFPFRGRRLAAVGLAAVSLIALTVVTRLHEPPRKPEVANVGAAVPDRQDPRVKDGRELTPGAGLAVVVKLDGVQWEETDGRVPTEGDVLPAQRFRLSSGRATLAFFNGVMLTLEGPAQLELESIDRVFCHRGRLRVRVPAGAEGFVVAAPGSSVVDLGTEFGLNVEDDGRARVMVFEGEAEAAVLGATDLSERSQTVEQNKAFEIDPRSGNISEAVADTTSFVASPDLVAPALVLDPDYPDAVLRSRPWSYWRFESLEGGVTPNEIPGGPPLRAVGPVRVVGEGRGGGCAVFDPGKAPKFLALDGLWDLSGDPGYAVELWVMSEEYNHATLVALLAPMANQGSGHLSLLELMACGQYPFPRSSSVRFLYRWPPGGRGGVSVQNGITYKLYKWHHIVAQCRGERMELYMDGVLASSQPLKPERSATACQLLLGRLLMTNTNAPERYRPFVGRLDELTLYDHALSAGEVRSRYQLATQGTR
jgi:ferric-dicitrate binding protein FerR (iron transport regulator)